MLGVEKLSQIHFKAILDSQLIHNKIDKEFHRSSLSQIVIGDQRQIGCCMVGRTAVFRIADVAT